MRLTYFALGITIALLVAIFVMALQTRRDIASIAPDMAPAPAPELIQSLADENARLAEELAVLSAATRNLPDAAAASRIPGGGIDLSPPGSQGFPDPLSQPGGTINPGPGALPPIADLDPTFDEDSPLPLTPQQEKVAAAIPVGSVLSYSELGVADVDLTMPGVAAGMVFHVRRGYSLVGTAEIIEVGEEGSCLASIDSSIAPQGVSIEVGDELIQQLANIAP
jgi:hypothetical protein